MFEAKISDLFHGTIKRQIKRNILCNSDTYLLPLAWQNWIRLVSASIFIGLVNTMSVFNIDYSIDNRGLIYIISYMIGI